MNKLHIPIILILCMHDPYDGDEIQRLDLYNIISNHIILCGIESKLPSMP